MDAKTHLLWVYSPTGDTFWTAPQVGWGEVKRLITLH